MSDAKLPTTTSELSLNGINVGVTAAGMVRLQVAETSWCLLRPDTALGLARNLMRMAFILEPPPATGEERP